MIKDAISLLAMVVCVTPIAIAEPDQDEARKPYAIVVSGDALPNDARALSYPYGLARRGQEGHCKIDTAVDARGSIVAYDVAYCSDPFFAAEIERFARIDTAGTSGDIVRRGRMSVEWVFEESAADSKASPALALAAR